MRDLTDLEVETVAGGFGAPEADGGGGFDLNSLGCPLKNNPLVYDPNAPGYFENGRRLGSIVPGSDGMYFIDQNCVVRLTEEGRAAQDRLTEEEHARFRETPIGRALQVLENAAKKTGDLFDGGR